MEPTDSTLSIESQPAPFWERAGARLPALLKGHAKGLEQWHAQSNLPLSNALLAQRPDAVTSEYEARQLEDAFLTSLDKDGGNKRQVIAWLQITYIVIAALNAKGANIHPVRLAVDIRPTKSPFIRERVSQIALVENWRAAFFKWLKEESVDATPGQWQAAALLCSSLCGCLVDHRKLVVLANQLNAPIQRAGKLAYFDFQLPYRNLPGALLQRWFPDPLSEMILIRAQQPGQELAFDAKKVRRLLASFLLEIGVPKIYQPRSLQMFANAVNIYWESRGTQIDVRFASSSYVSQSLKHSVWLRLNNCSINGQAGQETEKVNLRKLESDAPPGTNDTDDSAAQDEPNAEIELIAPWFFELAEKLDELEIPPDLDDAQAKNCIKTALSNFVLQSQPEYAEPYLRWLREMLDGRATTGDAFQAGTILKYFKLVVPSMVGAFGTETPSVKDTEELVETYGNILESLPFGQQRTSLARGLRELHDFLVKKYGCESVDVADTFGKEAEVTVVEARIISVDEYRASDEWLRKRALTGVSPKLIDAARLVLMLAFRLGMRRMEIIMLRLCDLHLDGEPDILVRPHPGRRLKSVSSKRRMPLTALLEPDELNRLLEWANRRIQEEKMQSNSSYLFVLPTKEHIPIERTVDLIHDAMREATGDDELHLHHLRHSFATWTYLKLRATSHPDLIAVFEHLSLTHKYLQGCHDMRQKLIPGGSIPSRSDAYCVSRLLGHSGPNVSMDHYIHSSDLLVYGCAKRDVSKLENPIWVSASGLPQRNAYRHLNGSIDNLLRAVRKKWPERYVIHPSSAGHTVHGQTDKNITGSKSQKSQNQYADAFVAGLNQIWSVLHLYDSEIQLEGISRELNIPLKSIEEIVEFSRPLAHQLGLGFFKDGKRERLAPPRAKQGTESRLHDQLIPALHGLLQNDKVLLASGLQIYFDHFNRQKKDVVFKSVKEVGLAKTYLSFLKHIGISSDQIQIVMRTEPGNTAPLRKWEKALCLTTSVKVKFIAPPNCDKGAYSNWLGIQALSKDGRSHHILIGGIFLLARCLLMQSVVHALAAYKGFPNFASASEVSISLPFSIPFQFALLASCEKVKDC